MLQNSNILKKDKLKFGDLPVNLMTYRPPLQNIFDLDRASVPYP